MRAIKCATTLLLSAALLWANEGLWLFNQAPKKRIKQQFGFDLTDAFLSRLRSSSVRLNNGGSGSFVSPRGLIFTNHHVAMDCIQKVSTAEHDYMKNGFLAASQAEEKACPALEVNILQEITDVTSRVKAGTESLATAEANQKRKSAMSAIEKECADKSGNRCDVVTLYSGGLYHLYRYKKYTDIRLVFAPESSVAAFGGDPDNFTYPRYCLDFSFLRAYENGKPADTSANHLKWSKTGARDGELTFVSGHPGTTGRLATLSELEFNRDVSYPMILRYLKSIIDTLLAYSAENPENKRVAQENLNSQQNSFKAYTGFVRGLNEAELMNRKRDEQKSLLAGLSKNPELAKKLQTTWDKVGAAYKDLRPFYKEYYLFERLPARGSDLFSIARDVYRYGAEKQKPNDKRLREYVDSKLPSVEDEMYTTAPITDSMEIAALANYFRFLNKELTSAHPLVQRVLMGKLPEKAAEEYVKTSKLKDIAERKRLANDHKAAEQSTDGMIRLVRTIDDEARTLRKRYEDEIEAVLTNASSTIAQARFAVYGTDDYPDATFTLRLSYGPIKGYTNAQGQPVPWSTDFAGMYRRATGVEPFALPKRWLDAKSKLKLSTPFDFVTTNDTHGGNSGSPTVDTKGEVIGILFDGNLEGLPNRFVFRDTTERSVHVASQAIVEALRSVYGARQILSELGL